MGDLSKQLEEATHADWPGGAPAVEPAFAQSLVDEVLRLRSLARYQPMICGHLVDDILAFLGMTLAAPTFEGIKDEVEAFKTKAYAQDIPQAWLDVIAERRRQMEKLGFSHQQDDAYVFDELPLAAIAYILWTYNPGQVIPSMWPWSMDHWKPKTPRENVVRAIALLIAEVERMDRKP